MNKHLIIVINDYPYNNGEPFFEKELDILSHEFETIYIFSVVGKKKEKQTRNYPNNVHCFPLGCSHNRIKYVIRGLFVRNKVFSLKEKTLAKKIICSYVLGKNITIFSKIKKISRKCKINLFDTIIYSYWLTLGLSIVFLRELIKERTGKSPRLVSRCHGYDLYSEANKFDFQPFQKEVINQIDYVCPCSTYGVNYLANKYPHLEAKIRLSRLGTSDHGIRDFDFADSSLVFVTCSGLRPVKRLDLFAKAFSIAFKHNNHLKWLCIGDGTEKNKIIQILADSNVNPNVVFIGDIPNNQVYEMYKKNNVFCFANTSSSEGIPVSIMEAISFGIPVIATDVGGNSEVVSSSNGFLFESQDDEYKIAKMILTFAQLDKNKYNLMRMKSRKLWEDNFNGDLNYSEWAVFLKTL